MSCEYAHVRLALVSGKSSLRGNSKYFCHFFFNENLIKSSMTWSAALPEYSLAVISFGKRVKADSGVL